MTEFPDAFSSNREMLSHLIAEHALPWGGMFAKGNRARVSRRFPLGYLAFNIENGMLDIDNVLKHGCRHVVYFRSDGGSTALDLPAGPLAVDVIGEDDQIDACTAHPPPMAINWSLVIARLRRRRAIRMGRRNLVFLYVPALDLHMICVGHPSGHEALFLPLNAGTIPKRIPFMSRIEVQDFVKNLVSHRLADIETKSDE